MIMKLKEEARAHGVCRASEKENNKAILSSGTNEVDHKDMLPVLTDKLKYIYKAHSV
jgi:hypothetical protein